MSAFTGFDFTQALSDSPLAKVIKETLITPSLRDSENDHKGLFLPLPFQTGIGKTYEALSLILEEILWQLEKLEHIGPLHSEQPPNKRTVIYITDSVDNVHNAYLDLISLIDRDARFNDEQKTSLKEQFIYLPRQSTQMMECSLRQVDLLIQAFELDTDKTLKSEWSSFCALNKEHKKENTNALTSILEEKGQQIYSRLVAAIQQRQKSNQPVELNEKQREALYSLIPGSKFEEGLSHVLFMTTRKYLSGFHHSKGKYRPLRDTKGQLLIIDEVDKQNGEILKVMVDKRARDLIRSVRSLRANLSNHRLENSPRYNGIEEIFEPLITELDEFAEKWHLDYSYNTEGKTLADQPVRLFSDRTFTHATQTRKANLGSVNASNLLHQLRLKYDADRNKNLITVETKERGITSNDLINSTKSHNLVRFVNEADRMYQHFFQKMRQAVNQYFHNIENLPLGKREDRSISGIYQEAVLSILTHYNLQEFSKEVFEAFDAQSLYRKRSPSLPASRSYHRNGLKLVDISQNEGTRDTVNCHFYGTSQSPSGLLADIVEGGAIVVGISATANANTVIHNFDITYLKERLGSQFIELSREQRKTVHDYYVSKRNYKGAGVSINVEFLNQADQFLNSLLRDWKPRIKTELFLKSLLKEGGDTSFLKSWLAKLLQAVRSFILSDNNRYMLCLCNRTISKNSHGNLIEFIRYCTHAWSNEIEVEVELFDGLDATAMKSGRDKAIKKHLEEKTGKVIVLSTFASMGAGKNPDYSVNYSVEDQPLHFVGSGLPAQNHNADIDTLYLEKPTNLLLSDELAIANRLTMFHQIMSLQESGDISPLQATGWTYGVLDNKPREDYLKRYYLTPDYKAATKKIVEQAVGRTARTAYKRKKIQLFADADLRDLLSDEGRDASLLSHEYLALVNEAKQGTSFIQDNNRLRKLNNLAARNNKDSALMMKDLVNRLHSSSENTRDVDIKLWEGMREQLLKQPVLENKSADWPRLYLEIPEAENTSYLAEYRYEGDPDGSLNQFSFFERVSSGSVVCADDSGLSQFLKNPAVHNYFKLNDFALNWENAKWIMTPVMYTNIYKPALAEQACKAVLLESGLLWHDLPPSIYERFDGIIEHYSSKVFLDVKFWKSSMEVSKYTRDKVKKITAIGDIKRVVYMNALGTKGNKPRYLDLDFVQCSPQKASIIEIPGIIDEYSGVTIEENISALIAWIATATTDMETDA